MFAQTIRAVWTLAETINQYRMTVGLGLWFVRLAKEYFGGLLPCDLVASVFERRVQAGHRSDRKQPDPNAGRYRALDERTSKALLFS